MATKLCAFCRVDKVIDAFPLRKGKSMGVCSECYATRYGNIEDTIKNQKEREQRQHKRRVERCREHLRALLATAKCKVCGIDDWEVLEFDHRDPTTKVKAVSDLVYDGSTAKIDREVVKCDVLCANCHRKKTIRQFAYWRVKVSV